MVPDIAHDPIAIGLFGFFPFLHINITIGGSFSMLYKQYMENLPPILTVGLDKK
jgi:hypothetical protein